MSLIEKLYKGRIRTFQSNDPDDTEGRAIYRAHADKLTQSQMAVARRKVKMAITEIPRSFLYTCDACRAEYVQPSPHGHFTNGTPPDWLTLDLMFGNGGIGSYKKLLCKDCREKVTDAVERILQEQAKKTGVRGEVQADRFPGHQRDGNL